MTHPMWTSTPMQPEPVAAEPGQAGIGSSISGRKSSAATRLQSKNSSRSSWFAWSGGGCGGRRQCLRTATTKP